MNDKEHIEKILYYFEKYHYENMILEDYEAKFIHDYINQLQSNWNSLREYLNIRLNQSINGIRDDEIRKALDKMNELEGKDNNGTLGA